MVRFRAAAGGLRPDRLLLRPNPPLSRRSRRLLLGALAVVMGGYSVVWASQGLWPVLPFAELEWFAVAVALKITARRGRCYELVAVDASDVRIRRRAPRGNHTISLKSGWVRVRLEAPRRRNHPARLLVGSHGRWTELGGFLTEAERRQAAECLRRALALHAVRRRTS